MPIITAATLAESIVLGIALAMDAIAVTLSNSLCEPDMPLSKKLGMPVAFALFQMAMPALGYMGGTLIAGYIERYAGIVSLAILAFVGGKMVVEAVRELREPEACPSARLTWATIGMEAVATAIDAFVVGVSFAAEGKDVILYCGMIGLTTLLCCLLVLALGRKLGERFGARAEIVGGVALILIGLKAFFGM